jgi:hypothetical protein
MVDKPWGFFEGTEMPTAGWWEALWSDPAGVLCKVGIKSDMDVIGLCPGDGWCTLQIEKLARHVIAIDIDLALVGVTRHRLRESGAENGDFVIGNAYDIRRLWPRPVDSVFLQTLSMVLRIVCGWPVGERRPNYKPSGRFAIINWHPWRRQTTTNRAAPERNCECRRTKRSRPQNG